MLIRIAPKTFLCRYPLSTGAIYSATVLICVSVVCILALITQVILMNNDNCSSRFVWRNAYSFSITGVIYTVVMLVMHIWLIWGVKEKKASVILSWFVITAMWLSQTFFLLIILICIYSTDVNFVAWVLSFILGLIAIGILTYFVLVVYGFWLELKTEERNRNLAAQNNDL
ncbi:hypothetical protein KGM_200227 [Danaus plexippus plexippus]|uniref:Uncharacterized protein n=2 Tax=Danaus plexippus TaxID=13037 RepID=A0A212FKB2_DANPL|nr:hypothetical protein KGM_200227 [Danaus plexippus plexippus]